MRPGARSTVLGPCVWANPPASEYQLSLRHEFDGALGVAYQSALITRANAYRLVWQVR